jgi:dihydrofolate reductase
MRKIIATEFCSLNNIMSDPADQMDWVTATFSEDLGQYEDHLYDTSDTLIFGRVTYKIFEGYWPTVATNPKAFEGDTKLAPKINNAKKIVFSKSLKSVTWENSVLKSEIIPSEIELLKKQKGKNILIVGSANIFQQFINFGLIDEIHIVLHPIILISGKLLFNNITERKNLTLLETKTFKNGVILLRYAPQKKK